MKKERLILFLAITLVSTSAHSQLSEKIKTEKVVDGSIIKEGKEIQGYIKITGTAYTRGKFFPAPWQFQSDIKFIPKDIFEQTEKIKNKLFVSYGPKEIDGYRYDTLIYESVKYADLSEISLSIIPQMIFIRKIKDGKIALYHHFSSPPNVVTGPEGFEPAYIECSRPNLVYQKENNGTLKLVKFLNIEKELSDCPYVTEKQSRGEYGVVGKDGEASDLNKLYSNLAYREEVRLKAIEDYNNNCR